MIERDECLVWIEKGTDVINPNDVALLSDEEADAMAQFRFDHLKARYAFAHALLRRAFRHVGGDGAENWPLSEGDNRRPMLKDQSLGLDFNLSHSGCWVAIAIACDRRVGIDVEVINESLDFWPLTRTVFSERERQWLSGLPETDQRAGFFRTWVIKESLAKARGEGLHLPFREITLIPENPDRASDLNAISDSVLCWSFDQYEVKKEAALAVCVQRFNAGERCNIKIQSPMDVLIEWAASN